MRAAILGLSGLFCGLSLLAQTDSAELARKARAAEIVIEPYGEAALELPPLIKANEDCIAHLMLCGEVISSELTERDCATSSGFGDLWFFPIYHRQAIGAAASSPDFTVLMGVVDSDGNVLDADSAPPGAIASAGAFATRFGNWEVPVLSDSTSVRKTGQYRVALSCDSTSSCVQDVATLCLGRSRYKVQVAWENQFNGSLGFGQAIKRTDAAGFFSFGDPSNIELLVKVLDFGDAVKVFYGQLTNLRFKIAVTDTVKRATKIYTNTEGDCGGLDNNAFPASTDPRAAKAGRCRSDRETLCLLGGRFAVRAEWANPGNGTSGRAGQVGISGLVGSFFFTDKSNVELVTKLVNLGNRIAFFYGSLSNLEYTIHVTDTSTGVTKTYQNPAGKFCGGLDNNAF